METRREEINEIDERDREWIQKLLLWGNFKRLVNFRTIKKKKIESHREKTTRNTHSLPGKHPQMRIQRWYCRMTTGRDYYIATHLSSFQMRMLVEIVLSLLHADMLKEMVTDKSSFLVVLWDCYGFLLGFASVYNFPSQESHVKLMKYDHKILDFEPVLWLLDGTFVVSTGK